MIKKYRPLLILVVVEIVLASIGYNIPASNSPVLLSILTALFLIGAPAIYCLLIWKRETEFTAWFVFYLVFKITPYVFSMENNIFQTIFRFKIYLNILFLFYLIFKALTFILNFRKILVQKNTDYIDEYTIISNSLQKSVKFKRLGKLLSFEVCSFYYCFFKWTGKKNKESYYTGYKNSGVNAFYIGLMLVSVMEAIVVHWLLISWNNSIAIIFLLLHVYLIINLTGHLKAMVFRRYFVSNAKILIRYGLFETLSIPIKAIDNIHKFEGDYEKNKDLVKFALLGNFEPHNVAIDLKKQMQVNLPFGIVKNPKKVLFYIDDVGEFINRIKSNMA